MEQSIKVGNFIDFKSYVSYKLFMSKWALSYIVDFIIMKMTFIKIYGADIFYFAISTAKRFKLMKGLSKIRDIIEIYLN